MQNQGKEGLGKSTACYFPDSHMEGGFDKLSLTFAWKEGGEYASNVSSSRRFGDFRGRGHSRSFLGKVKRGGDHVGKKL